MLQCNVCGMEAETTLTCHCAKNECFIKIVALFAGCSYISYAISIVCWNALYAQYCFLGCFISTVLIMAGCYYRSRQRYKRFGGTIPITLYGYPQPIIVTQPIQPAQVQMVQLQGPPTQQLNESQIPAPAVAMYDQYYQQQITSLEINQSNSQYILGK